MQRSPAFLDPIYRRIILLGCAGISLLLGLAAGSYLLGFSNSPIATLSSQIANHHAMLMVFGFVGGAICVERAVAIRNQWTWLVPALNAVAMITLVTGLPVVIAGMLWALAYVGLAAIYVLAYQRQASHAVLVQGLGALAAILASAQWAITSEFPVLLAACFPIATILGERLELARLSYGPRTPRWITLESVLLVLAATADLPHLFGVLLIVVSVHSSIYDAARKLVRAKGLPRYSASCMLIGYGWLIFAGALWAIAGYGTSYVYDAQIHSIFIGFVLSMIFAHAPTILGAVVGIQLPFTPWLVVPVSVVQLGLIGRVLGMLLPDLWSYAGLVNIIGVLLFMVVALSLGIRQASKRRKRVAV